MGQTQSSAVPAELPMPEKVEIIPDLVKLIDTPTKEFSVDSAREYMQGRVPTSAFSGALTGTAVGFYIGESTALYCTAYGVGAGLASTAFFGGTYALQYARGTEDIYNYAASGAFNAGWMVLGLAGPKRGVIGALVGAGAGAFLKVAGDELYDMSRVAWIKNRKYTIEHSKPKVLDIRKPQFHPRDSTMNKRNIKGHSIIPQRNHVSKENAAK